MVPSEIIPVMECLMLTQLNLGHTCWSKRLAAIVAIMKIMANNGKILSYFLKPLFVMQKKLFFFSADLDI